MKLEKMARRRESSCSCGSDNLQRSRRSGSCSKLRPQYSSLSKWTTGMNTKSSNTSMSEVCTGGITRALTMLGGLSDSKPTSIRIPSSGRITAKSDLSFERPYTVFSVTLDTEMSASVQRRHSRDA